MNADAAFGILEGAADAIISVDDGKRIVQFNPAADRLFGISSAEAIGQPLGRFIPDCFREDDTAHADAPAQTEAIGRSAWSPPTLTAIRADGSEFPVEVSVSRSADGLVTVFVRDATQRHHAEMQLQRARTMDAVAQLAAGVAHDFNNLLMVILGNLDLMDITLSDDVVLKGFGREAKSAAERGTALARQLLAFGRRSPLPRQPADVNALIARNEPVLRKAAGPSCNLKIILDDETPVVECNSPQLDQLLLNLVSNARDAMADGGSITIRLDRIDLRDANRSRWPSLPSGSFVRLRVSDMGAGMSDEALRRAFEPFFTTKPAGHGTGLGLAAVFGIANQLGGAVDAENNADAGSTFTVLLPLSDKPATDETASGATPRKRGQGVVLLVDDEPAVRATIRMILTKHGYSVIEAGNGREALDAYHAAAAKIHLVLTDLRMPEMDGRSLAAALRADNQSVPVLLMSGYDDAPNFAPMQDRPAEFVLSKPFTASALLDAIAARIS